MRLPLMSGTGAPPGSSRTVPSPRVLRGGDAVGRRPTVGGGRRREAVEHLVRRPWGPEVQHGQTDACPLGGLAVGLEDAERGRGPGTEHETDRLVGPGQTPLVLD